MYRSAFYVDVSKYVDTLSKAAQLPLQENSDIRNVLPEHQRERFDQPRCHRATTLVTITEMEDPMEFSTRMGFRMRSLPSFALTTSARYPHGTT